MKNLLFFVKVYKIYLPFSVIVLWFRYKITQKAHLLKAWSKAGDWIMKVVA
jgi:hypothetical protein